MIAVEELSRVYRRQGRLRRGRAAATLALDNVNLVVEPGETHGILGPNGAGKTTLVKILTTILLPTSGRARVAGYDVVSETFEVRRRVGIVFGGDRGLYDRISARQNLAFWGTLYRVDSAILRRRTDELLERVGLSDRADEPVERFSRGMRQRLHLARGLIGAPTVLFLDEPTMGMDPVAAKEFRSLIGELRAEGRTILLTTHDMREAETLCERVTLVDRGRILVTRDTAGIRRILGRHDHVDIRLRPDQAAIRHAVEHVPGVDRVDTLAEPHSFRIHPASAAALPQVLQWLVEHGVYSLQTGRPSLEDVYVDLIGRRGMTV